MPDQELRGKIRLAYDNEVVRLADPLSRPKPDTFANKIMALIKEVGFVKLAEDQSLPECYEGNSPRRKAFRDMLNAGFQRIEQSRGEAETRKSLAEGHGITFPNAEEAINWLKFPQEDKISIKRFELTDKEILVTINKYPLIPYDSRWRLSDRELQQIIKVTEAQVSKILSLLEPVELEALSHEEIREVLDDYYRQEWADPSWNIKDIIDKRDKTISQATIQKNQKGQLFRVKE